jgi:hypothetical protein
MEMKPYKLKAEIWFKPVGKGDAVDAQMFFVCDPDRNTECRKTGCGDCTMTSRAEYAKRFEIDD